MKWLTIEEIKARSKTAEGALKVSYEHWNQLYNATERELRDAYIGEAVYISQKDCGLCLFYSFFGDCHGCPLKDCDNSSTLYRKARWAFDDWIDEEGDWQTWQETSKAVRDKLKKLMHGDRLAGAIGREWKTKILNLLSRRY